MSFFGTLYDKIHEIGSYLPNKLHDYFGGKKPEVAAPQGPSPEEIQRAQDEASFYTTLGMQETKQATAEVLNQIKAWLNVVHADRERGARIDGGLEAPPPDPDLISSNTQWEQDLSQFFSSDDQQDDKQV